MAKRKKKKKAAGGVALDEGPSAALPPAALPLPTGSGTGDLTDSIVKSITGESDAPTAADLPPGVSDLVPGVDPGTAAGEGADELPPGVEGPANLAPSSWARWAVIGALALAVLLAAVKLMRWPFWAGSLAAAVVVGAAWLLRKKLP